MNKHHSQFLMDIKYVQQPIQFDLYIISFQTLNSITIELNGEFDFNKLDQLIIQLLWNEQNTTQEIVRMKV